MKFENARIVGDDVSMTAYRAEPRGRGEKGFCMSRGELMTFAENPHKWLLGTPEGDTESTTWGSLMDTLMLSPHRFATQYAIAPETYPSKGMECPQCKSVTDSKKCRRCGCERVEKTVEKPWDFNSSFCADWREAKQSEGMEVIKHELRRSASMAEGAMNTSENAMGLLQCSQRQVMVVAEYKDAVTGIAVPLKCLLDIVPASNSPKWGKALGDFKTALSCNPPILEKEIFRHNYDAQAALYHDMYVAATGEDRPDWVFIVQENKAPYEVADPLPMLSSSFLDIGRAKIAFALKFYARCLALDYWPSYSIGQRDVIDGKYICEPADYMVLSAVDWPKLPEIEKTNHPEPERYEIH